MIKQIFIQSFIAGVIASGLMLIINIKITQTWKPLIKTTFFSKILATILFYGTLRIYLEDLNKIKQLDDIFFILLAVVIFSTFFYYETKIKIFTKKCDFENTKKVNESIKK